MNRKRSKGSIDFVIENPVAYLECKRYTKALTFGFKSETLKLKWSQIELLHENHLKEKCIAGLILQETNDKRLIFVHIRDFVSWWMNGSFKSINLEQALSIGKEITDLKFLDVDTFN